MEIAVAESGVGQMAVVTLEEVTEELPESWNSNLYGLPSYTHAKPPKEYTERSLKKVRTIEENTTHRVVMLCRKKVHKS